MQISIVIPAYNEEKAIGRVIRQLKELHLGESEIIVIDDGSKDKTAEIVKGEGIRLIQHLYNKGYGAALKTGIRKAKGDLILMVDADGQHSPQDIERVVLGMKEEVDMTVGLRGKGSERPLFRRIGKNMLSLVANYLAGHKIPDLNSGLRAIRKDAILQFIHILPNGFSFTTTLTLAFLKGGFEIRYVPITTSKREGKSTVRVKDGLNSLLLILRIVNLFSPLRLFLPISLVLLLVGIPFGLHNIITGDITDTTILLFLSSLLIFSVGLLADQMANIRRER